MTAARGTKVYLVTGANAGLGYEAVRQLGSLPSTLRIYLACRNESKANDAIQRLFSDLPSDDPRKEDKDLFRFVHFDCTDRKSAKLAADAIIDETLDGVLLNAGGFGDESKGETCESGATFIAEMNLLGHVVLIDSLRVAGKLRDGQSRIISSGSEAALLPNDWADDDVGFYVRHLNGTAYKNKYTPEIAYQYIKGILALYFAAYARHHPELYVATISPGATKGTSIFYQGALSTVKRVLFMGITALMGRHSIEVGAKRYIDALTNDENWDYPSGSFVASAKRNTGPVCNQVDLPNGKIFGDEKKQELVWEAVQKFL